MAWDSGPERRVCTPGMSASDESSEVANVTVTNMSDPGGATVGGRRGSRRAALSAAKVKVLAILRE